MNPLLWLLLTTMAAPGFAEIRNQLLPLEDGGELRYAISAPAEEPSTSVSPPRPLVLALHYGWHGTLPPHYGRDFLKLLVAPALRELDAILIAPDCPEGSWTHPRSEQALLALIANVRKTYAVDPERIVVTGFSAGAMGSWFMASRHPELFSAAIPIAGPPVLRTIPTAFAGLAEAERFLDDQPVDWPAALHDLPILAIHSRADELVPFELTQGAVRSLKTAGGHVELIELEDLGHFETQRYAEHLALAIPWLRKMWRASVQSGDG